MINLNYQSAIDEMSALFWSEWNSKSTAICGYVPKVYWQGNEEKGVPNVAKFYAKFDIKAIEERQATLAGDLDGNGKRRYNNRGVVMVNIYSPLSIVNHMKMLGELSVLARNAFRAKESPNGVFFINSTIKAVGSNDSFFNNLVVTSYEYDYIG